MEKKETAQKGSLDLVNLDVPSSFLGRAALPLHEPVQKFHNLCAQFRDYIDRLNGRHIVRFANIAAHLSRISQRVGCVCFLGKLGDQNA